MTPPMQSDPITELREALTKARLQSQSFDANEDLPDYEEAAWSAVSAAIEAVEEERTKQDAALERADGLINTMANYIGKMAVSGDFFASINEHWLFMERKRATARRALNPEKTDASAPPTEPDAGEGEARTYYQHCGETWRAEGFQPLSECAVCGDQAVRFAFCLPNDDPAKAHLLLPPLALFNQHAGAPDGTAG